MSRRVLRPLGLKSLSLALLSALMTTTAQAQHSNFQRHNKIDHFGVQAGLRLTIPLGDRRSQKFDDRAKLQFAISSTRFQTSRRDFRRNYSPNHDLFAIGFDDKFQPRLNMSGLDLSYAAFPSVYANESDGDAEDLEGGSNLGLIIGGGLILGVGLVAIGVNELEDDLGDVTRCIISQFVPPEECES
ncbi:MAG: hypothetical protein AAFP97_08630 [Pseudomonadota bacterium]